MKIRPLEILLAEVIVYLFLWLWNDYLATLLSLVFGTIFLLILVISLIVEWVERSNVPRWYYYFMIASVLAPLIAAGIFILLSGSIPWMRE